MCLNRPALTGLALGVAGWRGVGVDELIGFNEGCLAWHLFYGTGSSFESSVITAASAAKTGQTSSHAWTRFNLGFTGRRTDTVNRRAQVLLHPRGQVQVIALLNDLQQAVGYPNACGLEQPTAALFQALFQVNPAWASHFFPAMMASCSLLPRRALRWMKRDSHEGFG